MKWISKKYMAAVMAVTMLFQLFAGSFDQVYAGTVSSGKCGALRAASLSGSVKTFENSDVEPEKIYIDEKKYTLAKGAFSVFRANLYPRNSTDDGIHWSSDYEAVASVDQSGKVTAKTEGTANITAETKNGKSAVCTVTVVSSAEDPSLELRGNANFQSYAGNFASPVTSYLVKCDKGYMILRKAVSGWYQRDEGNIIAAYYDSSFNLLSKRQIPDELPVWGGFYATDDAYYIVTGKENPKESDRTECFRVTKYDHSWNRLGSAPLFDCNTIIPFGAGSCRMAHSGDYLLIRTCHYMYVSGDGSNYQSNATILCDTRNMNICDSIMEADDHSILYLSPSYNQFVLLDDGIVTFDHSNGNPISAVLAKSRQDIRDGYLIERSEGGAVSDGKIPPKKEGSSIEVLRFFREPGFDDTGAAISGLEAGSDRYIMAGSSVIQDRDRSRKTRNIFVASADKELTGSNINWLTSYEEGEDGVLEPQIVGIGEDRFLVFWQLNNGHRYGAEDKTVYYTVVNSEGERISDIYTHEGELSDCAPVVIDGEARWFVAEDKETTFYGISTGDVTKFSAVNVVDDNAGSVTPEYRENMEKARLKTTLTETKEVMGRTVSVKYTGWIFYDGRAKRETDGCGRKKSKNTKSKHPSVSVNIIIDGQTVPPELITFKFKNNKKAAHTDGKKPPYFDITIKKSPENGIDPVFAKEIKRAFKGKKSLRFNIIPASLSGADTSKVASKTKIKNGKIKKTGGLTYLFDLGSAGTKAVKLKYDKTGKSRSKDYTASFDPEKGKLTVSGQNNYIGTRTVDLTNRGQV